MNKKAQGSFEFIPYLLLGLVIVLIFAIVAIPMAHLGDEVYDELKEQDVIASNPTTVAKINQVQDLTTPAFDQLVFIVLIAMFIGFFVLAVYTNYHPIVLGVLVLIIVLFVIVAGLMANVFDEVANNSILQSKASEFTLTSFILGAKFPILMGFAGIIAIIILLAKRGGSVSPM